MADQLEELLARLREDRTLFQSGEEAARQGAVLPILGRLGWDRDNIREVVPEYQIASGRVDYCLRVGGKNVVFLEVKRTNEELERHQEQLLSYAFRDGVRLAILTNGLLWWLYLPLLQGSWEQRKFFAIDIQSQTVPEAAAHFREFLSREAIATSSAFARAEAIHASGEKTRVISRTIPEAWTQLCQAPDEVLLELLAGRVESICGHRPDQESLAEFLAGQQSSLRVHTPPSKPPPIALSRAPARQSIRSVGDSFMGPYTGTRPRAYVFRGERHEVSTFKDILVGLCTGLYRIHPGEFDRVLALHGRKRQYFSRSFEEMNSPKEIAGSGIYVETNLSANMIMERCADVLQLFGYDRNLLQIERENS